MRFLRWALADARREASESLRLIRSVKGTSALRAAAYLERLPPIERMEVLEALTKRFHPRAAMITGDALSDRQAALVARKDRAVSEIILPTETNADTGTSESSQKVARLSSSRLRALAKQKLSPLGELTPMTSRALRYDMRVGPWTIHTIVSVGSPCYYLHYIRAGTTSLQESMSALSWLGVASQTTWDLARAGDEEETVESIAKACGHLLAAAPGLLEGLEPRCGQSS